MAYPPPPPPGAPGPQQPGYGAPQQPSWPQTGPGGYPPPPPTGGYAGGPPPGAPPPGYAPGPPPASGSGGGGGNKPLILLMAGLVGVVLLVVVGALVLVLAGGDETVELTQAQREDALLTDGDIGEGFSTTDEEDDPSGADDEDDRPDASQECLDVLDRLEEEGESFFDDGSDEDDDDSVSRTFTDADGATIEHSVGVDEGVVDTYREVVEACDEVRFEDETGSSAVRFSEGPEIDGVDYVLDVEFDFTAPDDGGSITYGGRIALWSVKGNAAFVLVTDGFDYGDDGAELPTAIDFDERFFEDIVAQADDKLREVVDEA